MQSNYTQRKHERGFSLIELMIVIAIIGILVGVGIPAWQNSVRSANEAAAIQTLKTIAVEQRIYYNSHNRSAYGTLDQLVADGSLNDRFKGEEPVVDGYIYQLKAIAKSGNQPPTYTVNANPQKPDGLTATGKQFFYMDSNTDQIHVNSTQPAALEDPPIGG